MRRPAHAAEPVHAFPSALTEKRRAGERGAGLDVAPARLRQGERRRREKRHVPFRGDPVLSVGFGDAEKGDYGGRMGGGPGKRHANSVG